MASIFFYVVGFLLFSSANNFVLNSDWVKYFPHFGFNVETNEVFDEPPDHNKAVAMSRYIMHNANWASLATISAIPKVRGYPFAEVDSMADGTIDNSTGVPYFYLSDLDYTAKDLKINSKCTISVSLEQTGFCRNKKYDPEDPRCARIMIIGKMIKLANNTWEYTFAQKALFKRHPSFPSLPHDHGFHITRLNIAYITMLDWFGGPKVIPPEDYFAYNYNNQDIV